MELKAATTKTTYYYYRQDKDSKWVRLGEKEYLAKINDNKDKATKVETDDAGQVTYISYPTPSPFEPNLIAKPKGCMGMIAVVAVVVLMIIFQIIK